MRWEERAAIARKPLIPGLPERFRPIGSTFAWSPGASIAFLPELGY
jgi:hypothetical protein